MLTKQEKENYKEKYKIGDKIAFDFEDVEIESFNLDNIDKFQGEWMILGYKKNGVMCQYLIEDIGYPTYVPFTAIHYVSKENRTIGEIVTFNNIETGIIYIYKEELYSLKQKNEKEKSVAMYSIISKFCGDEEIKVFKNKDIKKLIKVRY